MAAIWNGNNTGHKLQIGATELAAQILGILFLSFPLKTSGDIEKSMLAAIEARSDALITMDDQVLVQFNRARIVDLAMRHRLPVMGEFRLLTEAGALLSYSPSPAAMWGGLQPTWTRFQRRKARRLTRRAADEVRTGYQPQDCQGARPYSA